MTITCGGAMFGYCSTGSEFMQMKPTKAITILMAHAITYLLMNILFFITYFSFFGASGKSTF